MESINFILLNMLKRQLLTVYSTYESQPELLNDPAVRKAYYSLMTVTDLDELKQWQWMLVNLGLCQFDTLGVEHQNNELGVLDGLITDANRITKTAFIGWKCTFNPGEWRSIQDKNCELVKNIQQMAERFYDVHIILVLCGKQWVAIGNDADRLFEIFGWQTSTVFNGEEDVSFIFVSEYGYKVLMDSGYSIKTLRLADEENVDEVFMSTCFDEDSVCEHQQLIDYMRLLLGKQDEQRKFMSEKMDFIVPGSGRNLLVKARISIDKDKVTAITDDKKQITLADGKSWRLDKAGLPFMFKIQRLSDWKFLK